MPMDEINRNVLRMIKASDVGKMLSSADMALLETELETVPAQRVGGWLGEQIAKAARQQMAKGDFVGHPFRGNQWSDSSGAGSGGASAGSGKGKGSKSERDALREKLYQQQANMGAGEEASMARIQQTLDRMDSEDAAGAAGGTGGKRYAVSELVAGDFVEISTKDNVYLGEVFSNKNGVLTMDDGDGDTVDIKVKDIELIDNEAVLEERSSGMDALQANVASMEAEESARVDAKSKREQSKAQAQAKEIKVKATDPLDAAGKKQFNADMKEAGKAIMRAEKIQKDVTETLLAMSENPAVRSSPAKAKALKDAVTTLKEANEMLELFEGAYKNAAKFKGTMKGAQLAQSQMTNYGELYKGAMRAVEEYAGKAYNLREPFGRNHALDVADLQSAGDKNFGLPRNVDYADLMDQVEGS